MVKFVIRKSEKEVISVRLPAETLKQLDEMAASADISRNELINQMIIFAMEHMQETNQ